ncbi:endonuclease domain-containing protein [Caulobacter vibrioides]|nr:endonuclease domain-containing protein [Caulobacter vibrioides]
MKRPEKPCIAQARTLRRQMSLPEVLLWNGLRGGRLDGLKFRRQHPIGPYVLDFYCPAAHLAVEIDGWSHATADRPEQDEIRDTRLAERGVHTLRIPASEVLRSVDDTLATVLEAARPWKQNPPPRGGGVGP